MATNLVSQSGGETLYVQKFDANIRFFCGVTHPFSKLPFGKIIKLELCMKRGMTCREPRWQVTWRCSVGMNVNRLTTNMEEPGIRGDGCVELPETYPHGGLACKKLVDPCTPMDLLYHSTHFLSTSSLSC